MNMRRSLWADRLWVLSLASLLGGAGPCPGQAPPEPPVAALPGQPVQVSAQAVPPAGAAADVMAVEKATRLSQMYSVEEPETIQIFLGESHKLSVVGVQKVVISDPEIVEVVPVTTEVLVLNAKKPGSTIITLFEESGERQVRVLVAHNDLALAARVKTAIGYPDVNVLIAEENIVLEGEVEDQDERNRAVSIASAFLSAVRPTSAQTKGAANVYNTTQFPAGDSTGEGDVSDATSYTQPTPDGILDFLRIRNQKQIRLRVVVVALTKEGSKDFGLRFGDEVTYGVSYIENIPGPGAGAQWLGDQVRALTHGTVAPQGSDAAYTVSLRTLETTGNAKILAKPVLVTLDGAEASFLAGGKVILSTSSIIGGLFQTTTQTEEFGVKVFFRPKIMPNGNINLFVTPKVSEVPVEFADGSFRIDSRNTRNNVEVRSGDTIVLSGLFRVDESLNEIKFPWLADIPILGYLFKNTIRGKRFSEVMFLVTPDIVANPGYAAVDGTMETELGETKALLQRGRAFGTANPEMASKGPRFEPRTYAAAMPMTLAEAERDARIARGQAGAYTIEEIPLEAASAKPKAVTRKVTTKKVSPAAPAARAAAPPPQPAPAAVVKANPPAKTEPAPPPAVGTIQPIPMADALPPVVPAAPSAETAPATMPAPSAESPLNNLPRPTAPTLRPR